MFGPQGGIQMEEDSCTQAHGSGKDKRKRDQTDQEGKRNKKMHLWQKSSKRVFTMRTKQHTTLQHRNTMFCYTALI